MKYNLSTFWTAALLFILLSGVSAGDPPPAGATPPPDPREILRKMDRLYRAESSHSIIEMEIITPNWSRTLKMEFWSQGMEKTFIRIMAPKKEQGFATLRIQNDMWNYLPKTNKVMKIPPSMMMGSWMGSDFTNDDLVKEYALEHDYTFSLIPGDDPTPGEIYIRCVPREDLPIVWGSLVIAARASDYFPLRQRYYDEKGALMREIYFKEEKKMGSRIVPAVMELIPANKPGQKTVIRYLEGEFDIPVNPDIFSLRNLRTGI